MSFHVKQESRHMFTDAEILIQSECSHPFYFLKVKPGKQLVNS